MKKIILNGLLILLVLTGVSVQSQAALSLIGVAYYNESDINIGTYNLIYDSDQQLTWLDYTHEIGSYETQMSWANSLNNQGVLTYVFFPGVTVTRAENWRLPSTMGGLFEYGSDGTTTGGYGITSSEMGYLFHVSLWNLSYIGPDGLEQEGSGLTNTGPFLNLTGGQYWSGTKYDYASNPEGAWNFYFGVGYQGLTQVGGWHYAIAVRSGEVSIVPIPGSISILLIGLIGILGLGKRQ